MFFFCSGLSAKAREISVEFCETRHSMILDVKLWKPFVSQLQGT